MHLTFAEAYKIVCPNGGAVAPDSKEYRDITELMRQSGHTHFVDTLVVDSAPRQARTVQEYKRYIETPQTTLPTKHISKREWMSVDANKRAFLNALNKNKTNP